MQSCERSSLHVLSVVHVAVVVELGLDGPSSHHDISDCHSVAEVCQPSDHVTIG